MITRDEIPHERRLSEPIIVEVKDVRTYPQPRRDAEVIVTDKDGMELKLVIWETHEITQIWRAGETYQLSGVRGKRYPNRTGTDVELHSTKAFRVIKTGANDLTRILALGDSHVGYRHRPKSKKSNWAHSIDDIGALQYFKAKAHDFSRVDEADVIYHKPHDTTSS